MELVFERSPRGDITWTPARGDRVDRRLGDKCHPENMGVGNFNPSNLSGVQGYQGYCRRSAKRSDFPTAMTKIIFL